MRRQVEVAHDGRQYHVMVDGVDITDAIAAGGLSVEWTEDSEHPVVTIRLLPAQVRLSLPAPAVQVLDDLAAGSDGEGGGWRSTAEPSSDSAS